MKNSNDRPKAVVVGAGFSGLVTAYALERAGYAVEVYERSDREGGLLGTTLTEYGPAESGANAILNSARVESLFADLGIPVVAAKRESRARFIFRRGLPRRWPLGMIGSARLVFFLLRFIFARSGVAPRAGESLAKWGNRVFGPEATDYLLLPAFQGIYAGDGARLSATLLLSGIFTRRLGPRPKIRGSVSPPGGMGELISKLRAKLEERGVSFHFREAGPSRPPEDLTYYCGSAKDTSETLATIDPELSELLGRIEMLPLVSITGFFQANPAMKPGFGVLFPAHEGFHSLGVLYNHSIFPGRITGEGISSETWILGGARRPEIRSFEVDRILGELFEDRKRLPGGERSEGELVHYVLHRWPIAIPYYTFELEDILAEVSRRLRETGKIKLMGNYLGGIGLAKILDRIAEEKIERN